MNYCKKSPKDFQSKLSLQVEKAKSVRTFSLIFTKRVKNIENAQISKT